jgi:CubicO group peptidase (beta-lactamase class C family)
MKRDDKKYLRYVAILFYLFIAFSCDKSTGPNDNRVEYTYRIPERVADGWETASLADVGINPLPLIILMNDLLNRNDHYVHGILIIKDGKLVFEEYFNGYDRDNRYKEYDRNTLHFQASVTKSFTSALVGIAIDQGFISGVDEKMFSFFPEYQNLSNEEKDKITLAHMLAMASGIPWDESSYSYGDPRNDVTQLFIRNDPIRFVLAKPLAAAPGSSFIYNSGTTCVMGEIVEKQSGKSLTAFAEQYLFSQLGISEYKWEMLPNNVTFASGGLYLRPRDMAKLGQLYLQKGVWDGNRVISQEWVEASATESIHIVSSEHHLPDLIWGYGYQWWLGTFNTGNIDSYFAAGWGGQYIFVLPELEMVVVMTAGAYSGGYGLFYSIVNDFILHAVL